MVIDDSTMRTLVEDKDLPDIKPEDIKLDISAVDALTPKELEAVKQAWVCSSRTNEQLLVLLKMCPEKIERLQRMLVEIKDSDKDATDSINVKILRLKEEYAVVIKEIEMRKANILKEPVK